MKKFVLFAQLFVSLVAFSQNHLPIDWSRDLEFLKTELPKKHYNLYHLKTEAIFLKEMDELIQSKDLHSDLEMTIKLQQLIASLGDTHTTTSYTSFLDAKRIIPTSLMWFSDGYYILQTTAANTSILGCKMLKINGYDMSVIADSLSSLLTLDNHAVLVNEVPSLFSSVQLLRHFGFAKSDTLKLLLQTPKGELMDYAITSTLYNRRSRVPLIPDTIPLCYLHGKSYFSDTILKKDKVYYIQYNSCVSREFPPQGFTGDAQQLPSFYDFHRKIIENIQNNDFKKVIIDLRFNGGGNSKPGTDLANDLALQKNINQKGKLYVIIGRQTFSSAIINVMDFINRTKAITVGEETSGKPNHFGEVNYLILPSTGLKVQYSTKYFQYSPKDLQTITPDFTVEPHFEDYKLGVDPVFEWIKKH